MSYNQRDNQNNRTLLIILIFLLILSLGAGIYFWKKSSDMGKDNTRLSESVESLEAQKANIEHDLDSLSNAYGTLRVENEDLRGKEASTAGLIAQKDAAINKIKSQNKREMSELRTQVEELRQLKIEYETLITAVQTENEQLKKENERLLGENKELQTENSSLSGQVGDLPSRAVTYLIVSVLISGLTFVVGISFARRSLKPAN